MQLGHLSPGALFGVTGWMAARGLTWTENANCHASKRTLFMDENFSPANLQKIHRNKVAHQFKKILEGKDIGDE